MARATRSSRSGPGMAGLIFFIVLSVGLILGYVWLVPHYAQRGDALAQLQSDIDEQIVKPLRGAEMNLSVPVAETTSDVPYDTGFFRTVGDTAVKGVKYEDLANAAGYDPAADPVAAIKDELASVPVHPDSLKSYIGSLNDAITSQQANIQLLENELTLARSQRDQAQQEKADAVTRLGELGKKKDQELAAARETFNADVAKVKELMEQAVANAEKAWGENSEQAERFKKDAAELSTTIARLESDVTTLQEEITRKKPAPVKITQAHVLQADLTDEIVILDLGKREGIGMGELFTVMRETRGGELVPKAKLRVIRVDQNVSRAEIVEQNLDDPIMKGDIAIREKQVEEGPLAQM